MLAVGWLALGNISHAQAPTYTAVPAYYPDCGGPGCGYYIDWLTTASDLNDLGQVVGICGNDGGGWPCMVANGAELTRFFSSAGVTCTSPGGVGGNANAVNSSGQSVGWCLASSVDTDAWLAPAPAGHGAATPVAILTANCTGASQASASGLNDLAQVVGVGCSGKAFLYADGSMTDLGTLGGSQSSAYGINASGVITGNAYLPGDSASHAFIYAGSTMADLGTLGGTTSSGAAINNNGEVVGTSQLVGDHATHAFLYSGGVFTDLGTLGGTNSRANGMNGAGQIVGSSDTTSGRQDAFVWQNGTLTDLNSVTVTTRSAGTYFGSAVAINSNGVILTDTGDLIVPVVFTPLVLDFSKQPIGSTAMRPITVTNTGLQSLAISSVSASGAVVQSNDCPADIAPRNFCTITVSFTPSGPDGQTGTVILVSNAITFPLTVSGVGEVTAALSANTPSTSVGLPVTLSWKSSAGSACVATSSPAGGTWAGKLPSSSGTQSVSETSPGTYTFAMECTLGTQSVQVQTVVNFNSTSNGAGGGGGGALDPYSLAMLIAMTLALRRHRYFSNRWWRRACRTFTCRSTMRRTATSRARSVMRVTSPSANL